MTPEQYLYELLNTHSPQRLLILAEQVPTLLHDWSSENHCTLEQQNTLEDVPELGNTQRYDLAIINLDSTRQEDDIWQKIGLLRNLYADSICLLVKEHIPQPSSSLLALGFTRQQQFAQYPLDIYVYNIAHYNRTRSWNTPKYWANPENWGKFWW